jgi:orotate phosphoribosyltransferase
MDIIETLKDLSGYWKYEGGKYLAKLASGKVSDVYCNLSVLTCRPWLLATAVEDLLINRLEKVVDAAPRRYFHNKNLYVCGPAIGGVMLAYEIARQLGGTAIVTEPVYELGRKTFSEGGWSSSEITCSRLKDHAGQKHYVEKTGQQLNHKIPEGATVLFVTDHIITGKSTREMVNAVNPDIAKNFGRFTILPYILCLVNCGGKKSVDWETHPAKLEIISLAEINTRTWDTVEDARKSIGHMVLDDGINQPDGPNPVYPIEAVHPKDCWHVLAREMSDNCHICGSRPGFPTKAKQTCSRCGNKP